jgi:DNA-binding MarR family transcriptional regulator
MAIDESAGVRDRKDAVVKSPSQSYALATLLHRGPMSGLTLRADTAAALVRRGWVERRPDPGCSPWGYRYHLTDAGRDVATASPAVREWIAGWEYYQSSP